MSTAEAEPAGRAAAAEDPVPDVIGAAAAAPRAGEVPEEPRAFAALEARIQAAVLRVAEADPDPSDPFRGLYVSDDLARRLVSGGPRIDADARLADAARRLGLSPLEQRVLGVCAAPQLDPRYGRLFAYLQDDVTRKLPSPRLVARLVAGDGEQVAAALACFAYDRPLLASGALRLLPGDDGAALAERGIAVAERLAAFLLGARMDDGGTLRRVPLPGHDPARPEAAGRVRALLAADTPVPLLVAGADAAALLAHAGAAALVVLDVRELTDPARRAEARLIAALEGRRVCADGLDDLEPEHRAGVAGAIGGMVPPPVLLARSGSASVVLGDTTLLVVDVPPPALGEREAVWRQEAGSEDVRDVAAKFRLSAGQITEAAAVARLSARTRGASVPDPTDLDLGARQASSSRLGELATRLVVSHTWEGLVLPPRQREHLESIAAHLRHRDRVMQEWGYAQTITRGHGLKALFAGTSGTGKTMAAQVIASDLGLELYRVDLATVVSKYIGETEKNLDRIFDAAEGSNAIVFFDEADALFGKRSEGGGGDAHDRYANIEVAYLLQKLEGHEGAVILATNLQQNLDDAFLRRLDYVIDFPFPEAEDRRRIWALLLPAAAPLAADVDLDFLAERFKLAGGNIRNCALGAAYLAAEEGDEIAMRHLVRAVALEYGKLGRLTIEADFAEHHAALGARAGG